MIWQASTGGAAIVIALGVAGAFALSLLIPASAIATIVDDHNGSISVMKDNGSGGGVVVNGVGMDPGVNPQGSTIVFAGNGGQSVAKRTPGGGIAVLDSGFPGVAIGPEPEIDGQYLFEAYTEDWGGYTAKIREGSLSGGGSTELSLGQEPPGPSSFAPYGWDDFGWGPYMKVKDPSPSPVSDEFLYVGPTGRRCGSAGCGTVYVEELPLLMLKTATADEPLLIGPSLWGFRDPSWGPDGEAIVLHPVPAQRRL